MICCSKCFENIVDFLFSKSTLSEKMTHFLKNFNIRNKQSVIILWQTQQYKIVGTKKTRRNKPINPHAQTNKSFIHHSKRPTPHHNKPINSYISDPKSWNHITTRAPHSKPSMSWRFYLVSIGRVKREEWERAKLTLIEIRPMCGPHNFRFIYKIAT